MTMVLVFGGQERSVTDAVDELASAGFEAFGMTDPDETLDAIASEPFDVLVMQAGIAAKPRERVAERVRELKPWVPIVEPPGSDVGSLADEVRAALRP